MNVRQIGRRFVLATVMLMTACLHTNAQIIDPPYHVGAADAVVLQRYVDEGMVRRAYDVLRTVRARAERSAAIDALPFVRSSIERRSDNALAADREMETFLRERPTSPMASIAWMERGLAAIQDGQDLIAIDHLQQAAAAALLDLGRRNDTLYRQIAHAALFWRGTSQAKAGYHAEALASFRACINVDTTGEYTDRSWYGIGQLYERNRQYDSALAAFGVIRKQYDRGASAIAARIRAAQTNIILRRPERALDILGNIDTLILRMEQGDTLALRPQDHALQAAERVMLLRAEAATLRGRYQEALDLSRTFLSRYPSSNFRWYVRLHEGFNLMQLGNPAEAVQSYRIILDSVTREDDELRHMALLYHAIALKRSGSRTEAIQALQGLAAQTGYPYQAIASLEVGQAAYEDEEWERARKALDIAVRTSQDAITTVRAELLLGAALIEQQQWAKAALAFERAEQRAQNSTDAFMPRRSTYLAEARLKRGICLVQTSQTRNAITALTDFLGNHPNDPRRDEATFWLAEAMYRSDLLKNAQELYDEIVKRYTASPRREEALYGLAWTFFRRRDFDRSTETFGELLKSFPSSKYAGEALARRGDGFYIARQYRAAADSYEEAARLVPRSDEGQYAAFQVGQSRYRSGDLEGAARAMRAFVQQYPSSALADDALYMIGWVAFQQERYEPAIAEFSRIIEAYPSSDQAVRALYTIADAQYNMGLIDASMDTYRQVISRYPSHPLAGEAASAMQIALLGMGRTDDALAVADTYIQSNPTSAAAEVFSFRKAEILYTGRNYSNAALELEAYLKKYPGSTQQDEAMYLLGKTYLSMDDLALAKQAFGDLDRRFTTSRFRAAAKMDLAEYFEKTANAVSADSIYQIVLSTFSEDTAVASRAGFERATILRMRGDTLAAARLYDWTALMYPTSEYGEQARFQLAMYYRGTRQVDSMRFHLQVLGARVDNPMLAANALYLIGESYVRESNHAAAAAVFERVRNDFAGNEDWYTLSMLGLGESYEALQRTNEAKDVYRTVAALRPDDDYGKAAQARLKRMERRR
ncbi:MAG: tetratricopeptide repeat protein [Candidatus Kapabacteria bacterium]|nr:tetratricopeptide repeat protein [Candidatus Kapabacteria bacterium]